MNAIKVIAEISAEICKATDIFKKCRKHENVTARKICFKICYEKLGLKFTAISKEFKMDHSSVMYGVSTVNDLLSVEDVYTTRMYNKVMNDPRILTILYPIDINAVAVNLY